MDLQQRPISEIMRTEVVSLTPDGKLDVTLDFMKRNHLRHLPVLDGGKLIGIVSHRDLLEASLSKALDFDRGSRRAFLHSIAVEEIMETSVATASPHTTLEDAVRTMVERQIGCLPVIAPDGALVGLVTETDLLIEAFLEPEARPRSGKDFDMPDDADFSTWLRDEMQDLQRWRDELRVQANLAKAELRDRWDTLEDMFGTLERRAKQATKSAREPLRELEADARTIARELREGYRRIRDQVRSNHSGD